MRLLDQIKIKKKFEKMEEVDQLQELRDRVTILETTVAKLCQYIEGFNDDDDYNYKDDDNDDDDDDWEKNILSHIEMSEPIGNFEVTFGQNDNISVTFIFHDYVIQAVKFDDEILGL